ncbi:ATP-dependent endonuclease, partial [Photobacterium damselae subsp. damselae]
GTGKSATLEALNKLFSIDHSLRGIKPSDFHLPDDVDPVTPRNLTIEAWFSLTNANGNPSIPPLINGLTASSSTGEIIFRV